MCAREPSRPAEAARHAASQQNQPLPRQPETTTSAVVSGPRDSRHRADIEANVAEVPKLEQEPTRLAPSETAKPSLSDAQIAGLIAGMDLVETDQASLALARSENTKPIR